MTNFDPLEHRKQVLAHPENYVSVKTCSALAAATIALRDKKHRFTTLEALQAFFKAQWLTFPDAEDRAHLKSAYEKRREELRESE